MTPKQKAIVGLPSVFVAGDVVRQIRQHARSSMKAEICGVLIGQDRPGRVEIQACIPGVNAEEAGAHVTFTQDTWEHIYQIKDQKYPNERIVGWYHSHPGFGVFLSDHDTFIHKNFFSSPGQLAWVFDPHSDEEGCFGWADGSIERIPQISVLDRRGGERVQESGRPEPVIQVHSSPEAESACPRMTRRFEIREEESGGESGEDSLLRLATTIFSYLSVAILGFLLCWYVYPRIEVVPVIIDPVTGQPIPAEALHSGSQNQPPEAEAPPAGPSSQSDNRGAKKNHAKQQ